jgi:hypothetical protein
MGKNKNRKIAVEPKKFDLLGSSKNWYDHLIHAAASEFNIDPTYLKILLAKESSLKNKKFPAPAGELGIPQFTYDRAKGYTKKGETLVDIEGKARSYYALQNIMRKIAKFKKGDRNILEKLQNGFKKEKKRYEKKKEGLIRKSQKEQNESKKKRLNERANNFNDAIKNYDKSIKKIEELGEKTPEDIKKSLSEIKLEIKSQMKKVKDAIRIATVDDWRLNKEKSIDRGTKYFKRLLEKYSKVDGKDVPKEARYILAYVAYKTGSIPGGDWVDIATKKKVDTKKLWDAIINTFEETHKTSIARDLRKSRMPFLNNHIEKGTYNPLPFDRSIKLGDGKLGKGKIGSLENPHDIAVFKDKNGKETYQIKTKFRDKNGRRKKDWRFGKIYKDLNSLKKELFRGDLKNVREVTEKKQEKRERQLPKPHREKKPIKTRVREKSSISIHKQI